MSISEICIKRPVFATVLSLILIALGAIFFTKLQIRGTPDIDPPIINISTNYPGADALYMEKEVTTRIEKELRTVKYLDFITSSSGTGYSNITLMFKLSADMETSLNDVRSKISDISYVFPDDMRLPSVSKIDSDNFPSLYISVNTDQYNQLQLTEIVQDQIADLLEKLPSVGKVMIFGAKTYVMRIEPDPVKMYQYKISPRDLETAIRSQNRDYPAGTIKTDTRYFTLSVNSSLSTPEEFEKIILTSKNGVLLRLADIAKVKLVAAENNQLLRYNGKNALAVAIVKQSSSNIIDLSKEVRSELRVINKTLPDSIKAEVAYDSGVPVNASIKDVFITIFEALLLVILVTYLFLASARITLIPFVTIPVSLIATFSVMYFLGFSINMFTLLAMILAIGLVVDDAIVMMENIFRHHEMGKSPMEAAISASKEITFAIVAMTITLASVFLPIGFIEGFLGKLFVEFAWTLAFCVLFSGFIALTLTPMMTSRMLFKASGKLPRILAAFDQGLKHIQSKYIYYLTLAIDYKKQFLLIAGSSVILLIIGFKFVNKSFVPQEDDSILQISFDGPEGSSLKHSEDTVIEAEKVLSTHKDLLGYFTIVGWNSSNKAFAFLPLKTWHQRVKSQEQIKHELQQELSKIPGMSIFVIDPPSMISGGARKPVEFNLQTSTSYQIIDQISKKFINLMKQSPIFTNVDRDFNASTPTLDIIVNRDKAYLYGVSLDSIGQTIEYLINGKTVGDFKMGNNIYDVILRYNQSNRNDISDLSKILIKNNQNVILPIDVVANVIENITVSAYNHYNGAKSITISSDLSDDHNITDAIDEINKIHDQLIKNTNIKMEYLGEIKQMNESQSNTLITFLFSLIFIYLVLAAQFESFSDPLLILVSVPFSITGGVIALWIFNDSLNIYSNIGLITLVGLVTKNAIMLVEFANQLRTQGMQVKEAILQSASLRLRPILMTSTATICGAIPLVLASGAGSAARNSIGLVIVGGMCLGTVFTIFVIPVLYQSFKRSKA